MQRNLGVVRTLRRMKRIELHGCRDARQQTCTDADNRLHPFYSLHMRNAPSPRTTWKAYVLDARRTARLSQQALADALGVNKTTVWRWENEDRRPESLELAIKVADVTNTAREVAVVAAGFAMPQAEFDPRLAGLDPNDPIVRHIDGLNISEQRKQWMFDRRRKILEDRRRADLEEVQFLAEVEREEPPASHRAA
jgi:DNA-binding XRE family transcriptional regulator